MLASGHDHRNGTRVIEEVIAAKGYYSEIQGKRRVRHAWPTRQTSQELIRPIRPRPIRPSLAHFMRCCSLVPSMPPTSPPPGHKRDHRRERRLGGQLHPPGPRARRGNRLRGGRHATDGFGEGRLLSLLGRPRGKSETNRITCMSNDVGGGDAPATISIFGMWRYHATSAVNGQRGGGADVKPIRCGSLGFWAAPLRVAPPLCHPPLSCSYAAELARRCLN